jgi:hypothetical protein
LLADQHGHQRIVSQPVMVVEIFVAQRQPKNPLGDQVLDGMLDPLGIAVIGETSGKSPDDRHFLLDFSQQQSPRVGRDGPAIESSTNFPLRQGLKIKSIRVTLCLHRAASLYVT